MTERGHARPSGERTAVGRTHEDPYHFPARELVELGGGWYSVSGRLIGGNVPDWRGGHR
jgi:hypothetical protein